MDYLDYLVKKVRIEKEFELFFVHMVEHGFFSLSLSRTIGATRLKVRLFVQVGNQARAPPTPPSYDLFFSTSLRMNVS